MSDVTAPVFNPFEPGFFDNPYDQYARLREVDPVHESPLGMWVFFRYDDALPLLRDPKASVEDRYANETERTQMLMQMVADQGREVEQRDGRAMLGLDPPDHTRLRRLVTRAFTPRVLEQLRPRIQELVDTALDGIASAPSGEADLIAELAFPLPFQVISDMLGMPPTDRDRMREWSSAMVKTLDPIISPDEAQAAMEAGDKMEAYVREAIAERRRQPANDLLSALIAAEDDGDMLTEDELLDQIVLLYLAGHETTVNLIGNGTLALLRNPDQLARLREDPSLIGNAIEELLRFDSPVQFSRRITRQELPVGGRLIPPGTVVLTALGSANHDPAHFGEDAAQLDLGRPNANQHISFGNGVHYCLGAALARMEGQTAIGSLVRRFPDLQLAGDPEWNGRIVLRGLDRLPVSVS